MRPSVAIQNWIDTVAEPHFSNLCEALFEDLNAMRSRTAVTDQGDLAVRHYNGFLVVLDEARDALIEEARQALREQYDEAERAGTEHLVTTAVVTALNLSREITYRRGAAVMLGVVEESMRERRNMAIKRFFVSLIWPPTLDRDGPGMAARAGRVFHWLAAIAALCWAGGGLVAIVVQWSYDPVTALGIGALLLGFGVIAALIGRGVRYILSAE